MFYFLGSCGSTHLIELAEQIHKKAGRVRAARPRSRARIAPAFFFGIRSKAWFRSSVCSFRTDTIKKKAFVSRYKRIMGQKPVTSAVPPKLTYKNVHSVVCKHTRSLGNGGIPVSHTLPADLRLPSQVLQQRPLLLSSHHRKALWKRGLALTHSCSAVLLFLKSVYSHGENLSSGFFAFFLKVPPFLYVILRWDRTGTPRRADSPRTSDCAPCSARGRTVPAGGRNRTTPPGRAAFSGRSPP